VFSFYLEHWNSTKKVGNSILASHNDKYTKIIVTEILGSKILFYRLLAFSQDARYKRGIKVNTTNMSPKLYIFQTQEGMIMTEQLS